MARLTWLSNRNGASANPCDSEKRGGGGRGAGGSAMNEGVMSWGYRKTEQVKQADSDTSTNKRVDMEDGTGEHIRLNIVTTGRISRTGRDSSSATPGRTTELSELTWSLAGNGYDYASNRPHPRHSAAVAVHYCYRRTCRCGRTFPPL